MSAARIRTENSELVTVRDAMRSLNLLVHGLEQGAREKVVLTHSGKMRAVVVSVDEYARLTAHGPPGRTVKDRGG
jgi:hypothetical protein